MENRKVEKMILLSQEIRNKIAEIPESGMGYHKLNFTLKDGKSLKDIVVLNGSFICLPEDSKIDIFDIEDVSEIEKE